MSLFVSNVSMYLFVVNGNIKVMFGPGSLPYSISYLLRFLVLDKLGSYPWVELRPLTLYV